MADNLQQIYIRPRRGTKSTMYETAKSATVLKEGEIFIEVPDEGVGKGAVKVKIGDGVSAYAALPYALGDTESIEFFEERSNDAQSLINQIISGVSLSKFTANAKRVMQLLLDKFANYLPISGGTINGDLTVNGDITSQDDTSRSVSIKTDSLGSTKLVTKNTQSSNVEIILPDRSGTLALAGDVPPTTDTYDPTSSLPTSGKAVKDALDTLDVTGASNIGANKTIKSWSEANGKVSITTQNISITKSQVSDFPALATVASTGQYSDLYNTPQLAPVATSGSYEDLNPKLTDYVSKANGGTFSGNIEISRSSGDASLVIGNANSRGYIRFKNKHATNYINILPPTINGSYSVYLPSSGGTLALATDIPTKLSDLEPDSTHRLVTDTEKSTWNAKQNRMAPGSNVGFSSTGGDILINAADSKVDMISSFTGAVNNILLAPFGGAQTKYEQQPIQYSSIAGCLVHQNGSNWSTYRPAIGQGMLQISGESGRNGLYGGNAWYFGNYNGSTHYVVGGIGCYDNPNSVGDTWGMKIFGTGDHTYYIKYGVQKIDSNQGKWGFVPYSNGEGSITLGAPNVHAESYDPETTRTNRWGKLYTISAPDTGSDRRLKQDIVYYEDEDIKDFIMDLKPVHFKWKGEIDPRHHVHYGFIAQDVEESMIKFGFTEEDFGALGKWQKNKSVTKTRIDHNEETGEDVEVEYTDYEPIDDYEYSLTYEEFISPLIKMVQIQQREIDELKARVAELEK